jgi:hypothetical protein
VDRFQNTENVMKDKEEKLVERRVTYTLEHEGKFYIVENVPARVNEETGEQFFSPVTVEQLQRMILTPGKPNRVIQTPVYEYAE